MNTPAPNEGIEFPSVGFLLQWQFYFKNLLDFKPEESKWLWINLSRVPSSAQQ